MKNRGNNKRDVHVYTERTAIMVDSPEINDQQHTMSDDVAINNEPLCNFEEIDLISNEKETVELIPIPAAALVYSVNATNDPMTKNRRIVETATEDQTITSKNISSNNKVDHGPVVGYADEPLLPLPEACAPLINIVHDLLVYVQLALDETLEHPPDGLTVDESAAIRLYTIEWDGPHRSLYSMVNHTLKSTDREALRPYFKYLKLFITAVVKLPCVPPLTVWRGVTKDLSTEFSPGTPVTWWAFSSCTTALSVLENNMYLGNTGNRTLFSVEAMNGRTVRDHSHFVTEDEMLLLPGTHMIVRSQLSPAPDLHVIHLKQVIPGDVLLEPPFEGISKFFNHLL